MKKLLAISDNKKASDKTPVKWKFTVNKKGFNTFKVHLTALTLHHHGGYTPKHRL